ncbi:MAG TPA: DNA polymerase IV [Gammaproteobacteria bacterium]|nr:DNA polymerase IV [Gammaproteobacteria bacterium]
MIAHADMDAFYAAVEQLDDPALRGRPLLVGPNSSRGVVLTASYEARPFGVGSAMPMAQARRLCPQALVVPPRFERYTQVSAVIMRVFGDFSPDIEALSLDEAFIDMTGSERLFGSPEAIGRRIKDAVREATGGLTASVGVSGTKYVAKVASGYRKPDGLTVVPPADARAWLAPLPVGHLWGAGKKTAARLEARGFRTIGDIAAADPRKLERVLGRLGTRFHALACGEDFRHVEGSRRASSLSCERTLNADVFSRQEIEAHLRASADTVARRLRRRELRAGGVRVKLKRTDFQILTRQRTLPAPSDVAAEFFAAARTLLDEIVAQGPFRLVGLGAYEIAAAADDEQLGLPIEAGRARALETALDSVAERFGAGAVQRAADLINDRGLGLAANLDFLAEGDERAERDGSPSEVDGEAAD